MSYQRKPRKDEALFPQANPIQGMRKLNGEEGNGLVEYALVFMVFISLLLGIVDFSRALYTYHFLSSVAREATRYGAVRGSTCNDDLSCSAATPDVGPAAPGNTVIQDYVATIVPPGVDSTQLTTTPSWPGPGACAANNNPGCPVEVQVSYRFTFIVPFISSTALTLSSSSEMTILH